MSDVEKSWGEALANRTVVVVNDDPVQLLTLGGLLRKAGLAPLTFESAEAALAGMHPEVPPALIITDIYMPVIDGWRFCRLLRSPEYAPYNQVPLLVVSATFAGDVSERITAELGAEAFLPCPVDGNQFNQVVRSLLAGEVVRKRAQVLLVEDDAALARVLVDAFTAHGYGVDWESSCRRAAARFDERTYDLCVLDWQLPDGKGDSLLEPFRLKRPDCVLIMMSGDLAPDLYLKWMKAGASASLQKPFSVAYLLEVCARSRRERALLRAEDLLEQRTQQLRESERCLLQAQRLETVGRLASGVAHDFNNMVGVIIGNTEQMIDDLSPTHPMYERLQEVRNAAARSAAITRQLLIFSRKKTVSPVVFDVNDTVTGMLRLLRRLIGETINLAWSPGAEVWPVCMDPGQLDQILANLFVNARDAIGGGAGLITIATENRALDALFASTHPGMIPGDYVKFAVRDNGCGMSREVLEHIFEPFFTTKGEHEGTGLGLSTVYGIISQNGGCIEVQSEPGMGTSFDFYLPRSQAPITATADVEPEREHTHAGATVLIVEDESAILRLACRMMQKEGFNVLSAGHPHEALKLAREHKGALHLLLTDVMMPEMNGRELSEAIRPMFPEVRCLFMSGYADDILDGHVGDGFRCGFINKPYRRDELLASVRKLLKDIELPMGAVSPVKAVTPSGRQDAEVVPVSPSAVAAPAAVQGCDWAAEQFRHAQTMESLGKLVRRVAHDANNMIMVIQWYAEQYLEHVPPTQPGREWLDRLMAATQNAAVQTRQMISRQVLEFASNQAIAPVDLDINAAVAHSIPLLEHLIGSAVPIRWTPGVLGGVVRMDARQLDQILANVCSNARDAVNPAVGHIALSTNDVFLDQAFCAKQVGCKPGRYVRLRVEDNGIGMTDEILSRIFDPFFTTKPPGKGSGMGLPAVCGIVRQNAGCIQVTSAVGEGTCVDIYFPLGD
ncbi:MAG TPA: hypothetical protein DCS43_11240 [Verrucomicrobia bacterium]|nr:hypothetical protein [Verrucomicrobiota bacterium]